MMTRSRTLRPLPLGLGFAATVLVATLSTAQLNPYSRGTITATNDLRGNFVAAGCGLRGSGGSGTLTLNGIPAVSVVKEAVLYWTILADGSMPAGANAITLNGVNLVGDQVATTGSPCQPMNAAYVFRADATPIVSSNGAYVISNALDSGSVNIAPVTEGASLVVIYSNLASVNHDIVLYDGGALTNVNGQQLTTTFTGFQGSTPITSAAMAFIVADGETAPTDSTFIQGFPLGTNTIDGSDTPGNIPYWDTDIYAVSGFLTSGITSVAAQIRQGSTNGDCMIWVASPFSVSSPLPAVDVVTDMLTPTVPRGNQFVMQIAVTNNTNASQPIFVNIAAYRKQGGLVRNLVVNRGGTVPPLARIVANFGRRIPATVPPPFLNVPLYIVTTVQTRPGLATLDDDFSILYVQ